LHEFSNPSKLYNSYDFLAKEEEITSYEDESHYLTRKLVKINKATIKECLSRHYCDNLLEDDGELTKYMRANNYSKLEFKAVQKVKKRAQEIEEREDKVFT